MCFRNSPWYVNCWLLPLRMLMDAVAAVQFATSGNGASAKAVSKAYISFGRWLFTTKATAPVRKSLFSLPGVTGKSIVWQYFILKKKRYTDIV
jgi:hypothetical protein